MRMMRVSISLCESYPARSSHVWRAFAQLIFRTRFFLIQRNVPLLHYDITHPTIMVARASPAINGTRSPGGDDDDDASIALTFGRAPLYVERTDLRVAKELANAILIVAVLEGKIERGRYHIFVR